MEGINKQRTKFYLSFWIWIGVLGIQIGGAGGGGEEGGVVLGFKHD